VYRDHGIAIGKIPAAQFPDYRLQQIFDGYKWDYQSGLQPTISDEVVLLDEATAAYLSETSERLYAETVGLEAEIKRSKPLLRELGFSEKLVELIHSCNYDADKHIRLMRFDFHPTTEGWRVSEVNSDVPAGFQESSLHPIFAAEHFPGYEPLGHFAESLAAALASQNPSVEESPQGSSRNHGTHAKPTIAYVYDSHTVEDSQLLRFLGDYLATHGYAQLHVEPNQLEWNSKLQAKGVAAIVRHYPAEWLEFHDGAELESFFNTNTISANHPIAVIAQSKRLPLIWDKLSTPTPTWKSVLPETTAVTNNIRKDKGWIYKPAFGRVGEGINVPGAVSPEENTQITKTAITNSSQWIKQKLFQSLPIDGHHLAIGAFVVNGKFAGCFARASSTPIMNFTAKELPVLKLK